MQGVGTALGNTYTSKEGFGQAYILPTDNSPTMFTQNMVAMKMAGDKAKADSMLESKKKLMEDDPEYWYQDKAEVQGELDAVNEMGATLLSMGVDPYGGSKVAFDFQKRYKNARRLAQQSNYDKEYHAKVQEALKTQGKDKEYTPESIAEVDAYFQLPLEYKANNGILPPNLKLKQPAFLYDQYLTAQVKDMVSGSNSKEVYTDPELLTVAISGFSNPDVERAAVQLYDRLTPEAQEALDTEAKGLGMPTGPIYLHYKEMRDRLTNPVEAFDWDTFLTGIAAPMKKSQSNDPNATRTTSSNRLDEGKLKTQVELKMPHVRHPSVQFLLNGGFIEPGQNDEETLKKARDYAYNLRKNQVGSESSTIYAKDNFAESGYSKKVVDDNALEWLKSARAGNADAWDFIKGAKSPNKDYQISDVVVDQTTGRVRLLEGTSPGVRPEMQETDFPVWGTMQIPVDGFGTRTQQSTLQFGDIVDPNTGETATYGATDDEMLQYYYSAFNNKKQLYGRFSNPNDIQRYESGVGTKSNIQAPAMNTSKPRR